jgi:hypothetical protein
MAAAGFGHTNLDIWFTQDALDGDNLAAARGVALYAEKESRTRAQVRVFIDVSTAVRDFSRPRYGLFPGEVMAGIPLTSGGPGLLSNIKEPFSKEILDDSMLAQEYDGAVLLLAMAQALPKGSNVKLILVNGKITKQGLWDNLVPNTHLFVNLGEGTANKREYVKQLEDLLEPLSKVSEADRAKCYVKNSKGELQYKSQNDEWKEERRANHRKYILQNLYSFWAGTPSTRADFLGVFQGTFPKKHQRFDVDGYAVAGSGGKKQERMELAAAVSDVAGNTDSELKVVICAPMSSVCTLLKALQNKTAKVTAIVGDALSTNAEDNLVGQQWNEALDPEAAKELFVLIQSVPAWKDRSRFVSTQLFKKNALMRDLIEGVSKWCTEKTTPHSVVTGFQANWNAAKRSPQPIFDPAAVLLLSNPEVFSFTRYNVIYGTVPREPFKYTFDPNLEGLRIAGQDGLTDDKSAEVEKFYYECYGSAGLAGGKLPSCGGCAPTRCTRCHKKQW